MSTFCRGWICGSAPSDTEHPLIVAAKKDLLGTDDSTTLEQVNLWMNPTYLIYPDQDLIQLFNQIDTDRSANLSLDEVIIFFKAITDDISIENIRNVFKDIDEDGNHNLDFTEFKKLFHKITVAGWKKKSQIDRSVLRQSETLEAEIRHCFSLIGSSGEEEVTLQEANKAALLLKQRFGIKEVAEWIKEADINGDGEFKENLTVRMARDPDQSDISVLVV